MNTDAYMLLIVLVAFVVGAICLSRLKVSIWNENHQGQPLRGLIWFTVAIIVFCAVIGLLAG